MPKLIKDIKFPKDFTSPPAVALSDAEVNALIDRVKQRAADGNNSSTMGSGDTLVLMNELGYVEVYKFHSECECSYDDENLRYY